MSTGERPEANLVTEPSKVWPDQTYVKVVAANGEQIARFGTLYNGGPTDPVVRRAIELVHIATGGWLDEHPVHEVVVNQDDPS